MKLKAVLFDESTLRRSIMRIAHEIIEKNRDISSLSIIGVKTRGVPFAVRLAKCIHRIEGVQVPVGTLDISEFRDDLAYGGIKNSPDIQLPFPVEGKNVILVDDVLCTGRTVRAALDCLVFHGRPNKVQLAVLVDRGHRELPIRPDYVGKNIPTSKSEIVRISLIETDGKDSIELYDKEED